MELSIRDEFIKLGQAMKLASLVSEGTEAKYAILNGDVFVNGKLCTQRGKKLYPGDTFSYHTDTVVIKNDN